MLVLVTDASGSERRSSHDAVRKVRADSPMKFCFCAPITPANCPGRCCLEMNLEMKTRPLLVPTTTVATGTADQYVPPSSGLPLTYTRNRSQRSHYQMQRRS